MEGKVVSLANPVGGSEGLSAEDCRGDKAVLRKYWDLGNEYFRIFQGLSNDDAKQPYWNAAHWDEPGYVDRLRAQVSSRLRLLSKYGKHSGDSLNTAIEMQCQVMLHTNWPTKERWSSGESIEYLGEYIILGFLASRPGAHQLERRKNLTDRREKNHV